MSETENEQDKDRILKNEGAVLYGIRDIRVENIPVPELNNNDALILIHSVGICGSDLKYWMYGKCGIFNVNAPMLIGHEASGTVVKVGINVHHIKPGDRVAIEPGIPCRVCDLCKSGRYNLCPDVKFCATPPVHGNLCTYFKHPSDFCHKLPDSMSMDEGALVEPLAVAVYACRRGKINAGSTVLVCGAGPVGLLTMMVARAAGATNIIVTDIDDKRLEVAKALGADHAIKVTSDNPQQFSETIEKVASRKPDVSVECSGADFSFLVSICATRPGGKVIMVGRGSMLVPTPIPMAASKEVDIKGVFRYANCYPAAINLLSSKAIDVSPIVTHHFQMKDTEKAFQTAASRETQAIKVMIHP